LPVRLIIPRIFLPIPLSISSLSLCSLSSHQSSSRLCWVTVKFLSNLHPSAFLQSVGRLCHLENCFFNSYIIWYWQILQKKPLWTFQI
jgi:hypothetical protein